MRRGLRDWKQGIVIVALALGALWLGSLVYGLAGKAQIAWQKAHEAKIEYAALEARKHALQADLDALATPRGQDAAIREAFGVAKPGEEVIVVVPPASTTASTTTSWWQWLTGWF
jgi:cell division protein FtsB